MILAVTHTVSLLTAVVLVWLGEVATVVFVEVLVVLVETVGSVVGLLVIVESEPVVLESLVELVVTGVLESVVELSRKNYKFL